MNLEEIKQNLINEISKTEKQIEDYRELTKPVAPDNSIGRVSRMDAINNKSVLDAAMRQTEEKLSKLKYVLSKTDSPEFGNCTRCKNKIPLGRIMIKPESSHCVNCAM